MVNFVKICKNGHFHLFFHSGNMVRALLCNGDAEIGRKQRWLEMSV